MNKTSGASNTQLGADIDGKAAGDNFGYSVSLSSDGSRLAVGGDLDMVNLFTDTPSGSKRTGYVRVYDYNGSAWAQVGGDINAEQHMIFLVLVSLYPLMVQNLQLEHQGMMVIQIIRL